MISRSMRGRAVLGALAVVLAAGACQDRADDAQTGAAPGDVAAAVSVAEVHLGRAIGADKRVTQDTDDFSPNDTIYASVVTQGSAREARLTARWIYQDGQTVEESTQTIAPSGTTVTEFHISKPGGWPAGTYTLRVLLDGREVESEEFEVSGR